MFSEYLLERAYFEVLDTSTSHNVEKETSDISSINFEHSPRCIRVESRSGSLFDLDVLLLLFWVGISNNGDNIVIEK